LDGKLVEVVSSELRAPRGIHDYTVKPLIVVSSSGFAFECISQFQSRANSRKQKSDKGHKVKSPLSFDAKDWHALRPCPFAW
jgi:hypothetical protein